MTYAEQGGAVATSGGLKILPDMVRKGWDNDTQLEPVWDRTPPMALDAALAEVAKRYGKSTHAIVSSQLEIAN